MTFRSQGKLITVHGRKIAINALKDEIEAEKIVKWLKNEINEGVNGSISLILASNSKNIS